jgi:hypothetical protein
MVVLEPTPRSDPNGYCAEYEAPFTREQLRSLPKTTHSRPFCLHAVYVALRITRPTGLYRSELIIGFVTDVLDGAAARRSNLVSKFGGRRRLGSGGKRRYNGPPMWMNNLADKEDR